MFRKPWVCFAVLCIALLESCAPAVTHSVTSIPAPATLTVSAATTTPLQPTETAIALPTASITSPVIVTSAPHPLALDLSNAATKMKKLREFGHGAAQDIAWAPDGKTLAVASNSGVYFYDTQTWQQNDLIPDETTTRLAYSPDGNFLALATTNANVLLWNIKAKNFDRRMDGEVKGSVTQLVYDVKGHIAAMGLRNDGGDIGDLRVWDASTGKAIFTKEDIQANDGDPIIDVSPDGDITYTNGESNGFSPSDTLTCDNLPYKDRLLVCISQRTVNLVDRNTGRQKSTLSFSQDLMTAAISPNSELLATIQHGAVIIQNIQSGKEVATLDFNKIDALAVGMVEMAGSEKYLAATGGAKIMLWNLDTGELLQTINPEASIVALDFSPDHRTLASLDDNGTILIWDLQSGQKTLTFELAGKINKPIKFSPDGLRLILNSGDEQKIVAFNLQTAQLTELNMTSGIQPMTYLSAQKPFFYSSTSHLMSWGYDNAGGDSQLALLDFSSDETTRTSYHAVSDMTDFVEALTLSPDMQWMAFGVSGAGGEPDPTIHIYDLQKQKIVRSIKAGKPSFADGWTGGVASLDFSPTSNLLVSTDYQNTAYLWNPYTGNPLRILNNVNGLIAFTPDGRFLLTTNNGLVTIWGIPVKP